jgi:hypothetical protein
MKRAISCTCLAAAFAVGLSAQAPATSSSSTQSDSKSVTLTGCLRAGDEPGSFVLANTKTADKSAAGAATSTAATGTTGMAGATTTTTTTVTKDLDNATVKLTGSPAGVTLSDHVGHTVQITGTLAPQSAAASATAGTTPPGEPGAASASAKAQPSLNVTAFSMVSGTCSM